MFKEVFATSMQLCSSYLSLVPSKGRFVATELCSRHRATAASRFQNTPSFLVVLPKVRHKAYLQWTIGVISWMARVKSTINS